jgi:Enoyl-(Acyl carrier protein) reductase
MILASPIARVGEAQDIANGVLFLCTEAANYMTGQELVIDGRDNGRWCAQGSVLTRRRAKVPRFRSSAEVTPREMTAFFLWDASSQRTLSNTTKLSFRAKARDLCAALE